MGGVASAVSDVVGGAIDTVGNAVEDVGQAVVDNVVEPVVKTVENTVQAAIDDPLGTAAKVAAITTMNPAIIAATNAAVAVAHGVDLEDAVVAAGKGYAAALIAGEVASDLAPEFAQSGDLTTQQAAAAAKVAGQVAGAAATGRDPLAALVSGGINAGTAEITSDIPGFENLTKSQQAAVNNVIAQTLKGGDPSQNLINTAIGAGVDATNNYMKAQSSDLVDQTIPQEQAQPATPQPDQTTDEIKVNENAPSTDLVNQTIPQEGTQEQNQDLAALGGINVTTGPTSGYYDEITGKFIESENGQLQGPLDETSGTGTMPGWEYDPETKTWTAPDGTQTDMSYLQNSETPLDTSKIGQIDTGPTLGEITTRLLNSAAIPMGAAVGLGGLAALAGGSSGSDTLNIPGADQVGQQNLNWNAQTGSLDNGAAYGLAQLNPEFQPIEVKAAQGGIMSLGGYSAGGNPRLLRGPGDGMSDGIPATIAGKQPARLADGEFVVPADVVSHLGNGSTEAGANVLYSMMERVRKARTGNPKQGKQINPQKFVPHKGK